MASIYSSLLNRNNRIKTIHEFMTDTKKICFQDRKGFLQKHYMLVMKMACCCMGNYWRMHLRITVRGLVDVTFKMLQFYQRLGGKDIHITLHCIWPVLNPRQSQCLTPRPSRYLPHWNFLVHVFVGGALFI